MRAICAMYKCKFRDILSIEKKSNLSKYNCECD